MKIHCLGIACNDYPGTQLDLSGCVNDLIDWSDIFVKSKNLGSLTTLTNSKATRAAIIKETQTMLAKLNAGDWGIVAFSGHGSWVIDLDEDEQDGRDEVIVPYDYKNYILDDEIHLILQDRVKGSYVLLLTDSCFSGTVARMILPANMRVPIRYFDNSLLLKGKQAQQRAETISKTIRATNTKMSLGAIQVAGCGEAQYCYDAEFNGRPNGAFTRTAIDSLRRLRNPTFQNWINSIRRVLPNYQYPQTPCLNVGRTEDKKILIPFI